MKIEFEYFPEMAGNDDEHWIAYMDEMPGMVCSGDTKQEVFNELFISLGVKLAYDNDLDFPR